MPHHAIEEVNRQLTQGHKTARHFVLLRMAYVGEVQPIAQKDAMTGCRHASEITMMLAVALWGDRRQLDDVRLRCSLCGSTRVELRPHYEFAPSSNRA